MEQAVALLVDPPGGGESQRAVRHVGGGAEQAFEEVGLAVVVALGHPHPFAARQCDALVPLSERYTAVLFIIYYVAHLGVLAVLLHHLAAAVGRAVVQQYQLQVLMGLAQDALYALAQVGGVVVVGDYDRDHFSSFSGLNSFCPSR